MEDRISRRYREIEAVDDDQFDYEGYEIVRGEFFAHTYERRLYLTKVK